jgi:3-oxoacyl-[acyl-carrier-protein] synthase II
MERVVITGLGVVSPIGIGKQQFWQSLQAPRTDYEEVAAANREAAGGIISFDFEKLSRFGNDKRAKYMDRYTQYAAVAIEEAFNDAKLIDHPAVDLSEAGIILGSAFGCVDTNTKYFEGLYHKGPRLVNPVIYQNTVPNTACGYCAMLFGIGGVNTMISSGATSALSAITYGYTAIKMGRAEVIVAGGVERSCELVMQSILHGQEKDSYPPAEGAAMLILESESHAKRRSAPIYAYVCGYGMANQKDCQEGLALATREAAREALLSIDDIAREPEDESPFAQQIQLKRKLGDTMGASGAFAAIETLLRKSPSRSSCLAQDAVLPHKEPHSVKNPYALVTSHDPSGSVISLLMQV